MSTKELLSKLPGKAPVDEEGFVKTFAVDEKAEMRAFLDRYGFVVVRNVIEEPLLQESRDDFFKQFDKDDEQSIETFYEKQQFKSSAFSSWSFFVFLDSLIFFQLSPVGLIGIVSNIDSIPQLKVRQHRNVYEVYRTLLEDDELIVDHGRVGALRPTKFKGKAKPEWRTLDKWLHIDCNPLTGRVGFSSFAGREKTHDFSKTWLPQGLVALSDARCDDGGFWCVPGAHRVIVEWAKRVDAEKSRGSSIDVEQDDLMREHIQEIALRAGSLLVWTTFLPHANHPNRGTERWRLCQYVRQYPINKVPFTPLWPEREFPSDFQPTPLGRKLFGFDQWPTQKQISDARQQQQQQQQQESWCTIQ